VIEVSNAQSLLQEFQRRSEHAVNTYVPTEQSDHNQLSYHCSNARYRLLFGGNQSGKSHAAAFDLTCKARGYSPFTRLNQKAKNYNIWVISAEYTTIKNGIYYHLKNILPDWEIVDEGPNVPGHRLPTFISIRRKDGFTTTITFMSAKGEAREKFQAAAVDYFYIDEEIQEDIWEELEARTLATGGQFSISATLVESYEWIIKLEDLAKKGDPQVFLTRLNTESNKYLHQETVAQLKKKWSKETLEYRFYGKARQKTGIIYGQWDDSKHIIEPFPIPYNYPRYCSIDPGIRICAALWIAIGPDERAYAYRELYATNESLWQIAITIKQLEGWELDRELSHKFEHFVWKETPKCENVVTRIIDPKSRARSEAGEVSILEQLYTRYGIAAVPADNSLRPGLEDCRFWLQDRADKLPGIQFFNTLFNFFEERRTYRYRPLNRKLNQNAPIEDPIRQKNHLMDCWRYIAREKPRWDDRFRLPMYEDIEQPLTIGERLSKKKERELEHEYLGTEW
jgi:phage terminase large subunit-like protein